MLISVIILNWNEYLLEESLKSVFNQSVKDLEVIVIDSHSDNFDSVRLKKKFPKIRSIICLDENLYFAKGNNLGIEKAKGEFIFVMNPDLILEPDYLKYCLQVLQNDFHAAAVIGKLYRGKRQREEPGWFKTQVLDSTGTEIYKNRQVKERGEDELDQGFYNQKEEVFSTCGAASLYRRSALDSVKYQNEYFDEDFVNYKEDVDLGWRLRLKSWKNYYEPQAIAYHIRGWSKGTEKMKNTLFRSLVGRDKVSKSKRYHSFKNRYYMMIKNDDFLHLLLHYPYIFITDILMFFYLLIFERFMLKAYFEIIASFNKIKAKRIRGEIRSPRIYQYFKHGFK